MTSALAGGQGIRLRGATRRTSKLSEVIEMASGIPASHYLRVIGGDGASRPNANLSARLANLTFPMTLKFNALSHALTANGERSLASHFLFAGSQLSWNFSVSNNGELQIRWSTTGANQLSAVSSAQITSVDSNHDWLSMIAIIDSTDARFFIEGVELGVAQATGTSPIGSSTGDFFVGNTGGLATSWLGSISLAEIHDARKTPVWVADNWDKLTVVTDPDLVAAWDFRDGSLTDIGPGGDNLTLLAGSDTQEFPVLHFT